eukprot:COSAG06_NODE_22450_length_723_cov_0.769231_1_plen_178_part_00
MRNRRVHPQGKSPKNRDPEESSTAFFTDVKDAWSPESPERPPGERGASNASGGGLVPLLPIDAVKSDASLGESQLVGGEPMVASSRSAGSTGFGSTPRLSARKRHADEDDTDHRAPTCAEYYAPRNRSVDYACRPQPPCTGVPTAASPPPSRTTHLVPHCISCCGPSESQRRAPSGC